MSARGGGSRGGMRRSSSLTRLSGVGQQSQHGAQRVSGAAFDRVRTSGGNSKTLLFFRHICIVSPVGFVNFYIGCQCILFSYCHRELYISTYTYMLNYDDLDVFGKQITNASQIAYKHNVIQILYVSMWYKVAQLILKKKINKRCH